MSSLQGSQWHRRPLCTSYLLFNVEALHLPMQEAGQVCNVAAWWAVGALHDGQLELAGVWLAQAADEVPWTRVLDDLSERGVERIRYIVESGHSGPFDDDFVPDALCGAGRLLLGSGRSLPITSATGAESGPPSMSTELERRHRRILRRTSDAQAMVTR